MTGAQVQCRLLAALGLATINLRTSLLATSPLIPLIRADLALSYLEAGVVLSLPVIMLGLGALPGAALANYLGTHRIITYGLLVTTIAALIRVFSTNFWFLATTTAILAAGVGLVQPSLPVLVRERFPNAISTATSIYSAGLTGGATAAAVITPTVFLPLAGVTTWRGALLLWGIISLLSCCFWWLSAQQWAPGPSRSGHLEETDNRHASPVKQGSIWREPFLWKVAFLFAGQSILFHIFTSWLPTFYAGLGWTLARAAVPIALLTALQVPTSLLLPNFAGRYGLHRQLLIGSVALTAVGELGIITAPAALSGILWGLTLGIGIGGIFSLTLTLQASHHGFGNNAQASGMMFGIGYACAAIGPILLGLIRDLTGSFTGGFMATLAVSSSLAAVALTIAPGQRFDRQRGN